MYLCMCACVCVCVSSEMGGRLLVVITERYFWQFVGRGKNECSVYTIKIVSPKAISASTEKHCLVFNILLLKVQISRSRENGSFKFLSVTSDRKPNKFTQVTKKIHFMSLFRHS